MKNKLDTCQLLAIEQKKMLVSGFESALWKYDNLAVSCVFLVEHLKPPLIFKKIDKGGRYFFLFLMIILG